MISYIDDEDGNTYMGHHQEKDYVKLSEKEYEKLAKSGNKKAEELGIKTRYKVVKD